MGTSIRILLRYLRSVESFLELYTESSNPFTEDTNDRVCQRKKPSSTPVNLSPETLLRLFPHKVLRLFTTDSVMTTRKLSKPPTLPLTSLRRKSFKKFTTRSVLGTKSEP